jgi:hypothetical protein
VAGGGGQLAVSRNLRWAAAALLVLCDLAGAHEGGITGYAAVDVAANALRYQLTLSEPPPALLQAQDGDRSRALATIEAALRDGLHADNAGTPCAIAAVSSVPPSAARLSVSVSLDFVCHDEIAVLNLRDDSFDTLGTDLHVLGQVTTGERTQEFTLSAERRSASVVLADPAASTTSRSAFVAFLGLGLEHILIGYDHLLFLFALLLAPAPLGSTVKIVSAFTVAHSITLALAALDLLRLPVVLVEAAIAVSIAYVAAENLWARNPLSRRAGVTVLFGLVHGCGFASVLRDIGLPTAGLWRALLGFNIGVELGQLAVVLLMVPALSGLGRLPASRRVVPALSVLVCASGLVLFVARVLTMA